MYKTVFFASNKKVVFKASKEGFLLFKFNKKMKLSVSETQKAKIDTREMGNNGSSG